MVNVGMMSTKGKASSIKLTTAPTARFLPLNNTKNNMADTGAHTTSNSSPNAGTR